MGYVWRSLYGEHLTNGRNGKLGKLMRIALTLFKKYWKLLGLKSLCSSKSWKQTERRSKILSIWNSLVLLPLVTLSDFVLLTSWDCFSGDSDSLKWILSRAQSSQAMRLFLSLFIAYRIRYVDLIFKKTFAIAIVKSYGRHLLGNWFSYQWLG